MLWGTPTRRPAQAWPGSPDGDNRRPSAVRYFSARGGPLPGSRHYVSVGRGSEDRGRLEPLDDEVDGKRRFPGAFRKCSEVRCRRAVLESTKQDGDSRGEDQGAPDESQQCHAPGHEAGLIHQVAEQQPVSESGTEAGPEQERPVMDGNQCPLDKDE